MTGTPGYDKRRTAALVRWCDSAQTQLSAVGLLDGKALTTNKLLNRLLGMPVETQGQIFAYFTTILDKVIADAKKEGKYDATGIIKPGCESIEFRCGLVWSHAGFTPANRACRRHAADCDGFTQWDIIGRSQPRHQQLLNMSCLLCAFACVLCAAAGIPLS